MAVILTVRVKGDPAILTAGYDAIAAYEEALVPELGCHICAKTADGILVAGVWKSREAFERLFATPGFQKILAAQRMPAPEIEIFELHQSRHQPGGAP